MFKYSVALSGHCVIQYGNTRDGDEDYIKIHSSEIERKIRGLKFGVHNPNMRFTLFTSVYHL